MRLEARISVIPLILMDPVPLLIIEYRADL
jgi:hypothetical protein